MTNNDVLRHVRHILNVNDGRLVEITRLADYDVSKEEITAFLKRDDEEGYQECPDEMMAHFLNGLIYFKRGKNPDFPPPKLERRINNNIVLKKLRVAFALKDTDIVAKIEKAGIRVSKTEVNAFFRDPHHRNYRECLDQFLRNLFKGLSA